MGKNLQKQDLLAGARERFWNYVDRRGLDECWPWTAGLCAGYGWFYVGGGREQNFSAYAHRVSLHYATGEWGRVARHSCDNPQCCNPNHLAWGSHGQNSQDALVRRRAYVGEANSNATLTDAKVAEARSLRAGGMTYKAIGARLGVMSGTIRSACTGGWSHV